MLVSLQEVLSWAQKNFCAIGAFNTPNFECVQAAIETAQKFRVPVIISHAQLHENIAPLDVIGPVMILEATQANVPVCVHLDHCEDLDYMQKALKIGFTGVMYDGSMLPYEENVRNTKKAVAMANSYGAGVEAEIGTLAMREGGYEAAAGPVYTDPLIAKQFSEETGIHALAPSFGTAHGIYKTKPVLDLNRVAKIRDITGLPLVMHGGSGMSKEDYQSAIANGIGKINYYSYMSRAGVWAVRSLLDKQDVSFFHDLALAAKDAMQVDIETAVRTFYHI